VIRGLARRFGRRPDGTDDPALLRAEIERLRLQNEKMKRAMRHCIDCEYRIEVITTRAENGRAAAGGEPTS
jgi:hypothetical protein